MDTRTVEIFGGKELKMLPGNERWLQVAARERLPHDIGLRWFSCGSAMSWRGIACTWLA